MADTQPLPPTKAPLSIWGRLLLVPLILNGLVGVAGGIALMKDVMPFPVVWLQNSPFHSYFVPGLILGLVIGGTHLVAAFILLRHPSAAGIASRIAGLVLLGWMAGELRLIGFLAPIQVFFVTMGLLEVGLSFTRLRRS